ncbi:50S ribosomal protein L10 [bacterium]|nr:50S ribosomal protein L10 [bacterium]
MPNPAKIEAVKKLKILLSEYNIHYITDHTGLNVAQVSDLRRKLSESGSTMRVAKNRLIQIARAESGLSRIDDVFEGPTSMVLAKDDPVPSARVLKMFINDISMPQIKAVIIDDKMFSLNRFDEIAAMPCLDQLRANFIGAMASPMTGLAIGLSGLMRGLVVALSAISEKKQEE